MPEVEAGAKRSMEYDEYNNEVNKVSKSDDMEVRLLLLERSCGGIIGKGGENISRLRSTYTVNVQMPSTRTVDRACTVRGSLENCLSVIKELLAHSTHGPFSTTQQCPIEINLLVQTGMIGSILGKGGERIKEMRETTNAKIKVYEECLPCSNERVIAIGGDDEEQVVAVLSTILNLLKEIPGRSRPMYYNPANTSNEIMGGGMHNMQDSSKNGRNSSVFLQLQTVTKITATNDVCGAIIGKGGSRIGEIRRSSGANINFSESEKESNAERFITITGTQQQVQVAEQLITQYLQKYATTS